MEGGGGRKGKEKQNGERFSQRKKKKKKEKEINGLKSAGVSPGHGCAGSGSLGEVCGWVAGRFGYNQVHYDFFFPLLKQVKAMVTAVNLGNQCERPCRKYSKHFPSCNIRK